MTCINTVFATNMKALQNAPTTGWIYTQQDIVKTVQGVVKERKRKE